MLDSFGDSNDFHFLTGLFCSGENSRLGRVLQRPCCYLSVVLLIFDMLSQSGNTYINMWVGEQMPCQGKKVSRVHVNFSSEQSYKEEPLGISEAGLLLAGCPSCRPTNSVQALGGF